MVDVKKVRQDISGIVEDTDVSGEDFQATQSLTQSVTYCVLYVYGLTIKRRRELGSDSVVFTARDYENNRPAHFPSRWTCARKMGSWENIYKLIPMDTDRKNERKHKGIIHLATPHGLWYALRVVAHTYGVSPENVSVSNMRRYRSEHPENTDVLDWKTYLHFTPDNSWVSAKSIALGLPKNSRR